VGTPDEVKRSDNATVKKFLSADFRIAK